MGIVRQWMHADHGRDGYAQAWAALTGWEKKQLPYATARSLTKMAGVVKQEFRGSMETHFDEPVLFTLNSTYVKPATKLVAAVSYLTPEVQGAPC